MRRVVFTRAIIRRLVAFLVAGRKVLLLLGALLGVLLLVGAGGVALSSRPDFCVTCHEIRPAYDQWRTSLHYGVNCLDCHTEPGLAGYLKVNLAGARHTLVHLTAGYHIPENPDVKDESCLRCHSREKRPEESLRTTLRIAHSKHTKERCADCHGRLVHIPPGEARKGDVEPHEVRDCTVCHTPQTCPHGEAEVACMSCHKVIIPRHEPARERGILRESCQECHSKLKVGSPEYCQTCHVSPHGINVACSRCHTSRASWTEHTFRHPVELVGRHAALQCSQCHGVQRLTGLKYDCALCHAPPAPHTWRSDCAKCHSPEGWRPAKLTHKFPQNHSGASDCSTCHAGRDFSRYTCTTCHTPPAVEAKHSPKGIVATAVPCATCHPQGKKP
ncbi:MAG: NapC/NirT family cytochrome c [Chloroflexota bacterium]